MKVSLLFGFILSFVNLNLRNKKKIDAKIIRLKNTNIKTPLVGSFAKVCTELSIPDLTRKVPVTLNINVIKQRIIVQKYSTFLFSKTNNECKRAVIANHGSKDAFSTGSQNQNPPQPNS